MLCCFERLEYLKLSNFTFRTQVEVMRNVAIDLMMTMVISTMILH